METVGLIPAAGRATRLGRLPCSKEVLPVPDGRGGLRPLCADLLEGYAAAGVRRVYVVIRRGKWDIPDVLGDGSQWGLELAYLVTPPTAGSLETVDRAFPYLRNRRVALGFPDILFEPRTALAPLLARADAADLVLGLFPTDEPQRCDLVDYGPDGRVRALEIKPRSSRLRETWMFAVWNPTFTELLHRYARASPAPPDRDRHVGEAVQAALRGGLRVLGVPVPGGRARDLGTVAALVEHLRGT